jgi:hypothetical protein
MRIEMVLVLHIANAKAIKLFRAAAASPIGRQKNRPGNESADYADEYQSPHETKKQVRIKRLMVKHKLIRNGSHSMNPVEVTRRFWTWRAILFWHGANVRPW